MAVFTEESVKANIRNRDGARVFYLAEGDHLTPSAREWLRKERVAVLPGTAAAVSEYRTVDGAKLLEKPEHMTHLRNGVLVPKTHPRIRFRGSIDTLEAEILLVGNLAASQGRSGLKTYLNEILRQIRNLIRCDVLDEPVCQEPICGETMEQLREKSHHPESYYGQPHFMPDFSDDPILLRLNLLRTRIREAELMACDAFSDRDGCIRREDMVLLLNRMSSLVWILMIRLKKGERFDG